jgi:N-acetylmuramoyl-L-alanine amidase
MITASDIDTLARTVWAEARGEQFLGQRAVANVVINRWETDEGQFKRDDTIAMACLRPNQFSCWNAADPNFEEMQTISFGARSFRTAMRAALEAFDEPDLTEGARHYHTAGVSPEWSKRREPVVVIGKHYFFVGIL